jgi:putative hemolysin
VLPVFVKGRNSPGFLGVSFLSRTLSMLMLSRELFNKGGRVIGLRVGDLVPASAWSGTGLRERALAQALRKHVALIGKGKKGLFKTESSIAHPVDRRALRAELARTLPLGSTPDGKRIYLAEGSLKALMREIARLRELTFRRVGEGTGQRQDLDEYDRPYKHIVLWDEAEWEVVGAYRIGDCPEILRSRGIEGLYSASLFDLGPGLRALLPQALEMGRSFVQPRYWNSRALDLLWQGIGALLASRPDVRYLFGCVSISASYPEPAREMIVHFFKTWFGSGAPEALSKNPYRISRGREAELAALFPGREYRAEMRQLKSTLKEFGGALPTLYRQYTELCEPGGVRFHDFGVDRGFGSCVDGFMVMDLTFLSAEKRARYLEPAAALATGAKAAS